MQYQGLRAFTVGILTTIGIALVALWGGYATVTNGGTFIGSAVNYTWAIGLVSLLGAALLIGSGRRSDLNTKLTSQAETSLAASQPVSSPTQSETIPDVGDEQAIAHLEALRKDVRDEIKQRIKQRDRYSIELTFGLGALVAIALAHPDIGLDLGKVLIAAPLISIYFTVLILYSYRIHTLLAHYLRDQIEPELARLCGTSPESEWERYYVVHAVPGIRKIFFLGSLWVVTAVSLAFLWWAYGQQSDFDWVLAVATAIYTSVTILVTRIFWKG